MAPIELRNKAQYGLAIKIESYSRRQRHLASEPKPRNKQMPGRILPRRACNPCKLYNENEF